MVDRDIIDDPSGVHRPHSNGMSAREFPPVAKQGGGYDGGGTDRKRSPPREKKLDTPLTKAPGRYSSIAGKRRQDPTGVQGLPTQENDKPVMNHATLAKLRVPHGSSGHEASTAEAGPGKVGRGERARSGPTTKPRSERWTSSRAKSETARSPARKTLLEV